MAARRARTNEPVVSGAAGTTQPVRRRSPRRVVGPAEVIVLTVSDPGSAEILARWREHLACVGQSASTLQPAVGKHADPTPRSAAHGHEGGRTV